MEYQNDDEESLGLIECEGDNSDEDENSSNDEDKDSSNANSVDSSGDYKHLRNHK